MGALKKTSIYIDENLDEALAAKAAEEGVSKAEFIRRNLEVVVSRPKRPRISVGIMSVGPPAWARDLDHELGVYLDRQDREDRGVDG
ncbi:MAG: ribbon-helix-helix protein, CopG family [Actinomycetota bacterium]|nr:ribbon-helix-helix protein, CopG family [Actinomycetota bacterium]